MDKLCVSSSCIGRHLSPWTIEWSVGSRTNVDRNAVGRHLHRERRNVGDVERAAHQIGDAVVDVTLDGQHGECVQAFGPPPCKLVIRLRLVRLELAVVGT